MTTTEAGGPMIGLTLLPGQARDLDRLLALHGTACVAARSEGTRKVFFRALIARLNGREGRDISVVAPPGDFDIPSHLLAPTRSGRGSLVNGLVFSMREDIEAIIVDPADKLEYPEIMKKAHFASRCGYRVFTGVEAENLESALQIVTLGESFEVNLIRGVILLERFSRMTMANSNPATPELVAALREYLGDHAQSARVFREGGATSADDVIAIELHITRDTSVEISSVDVILEKIRQTPVAPDGADISLFEHAGALCASGLIDALSFLELQRPDDLCLEGMRERIPGHVKNLAKGAV